jgi:hypothetical protein
MSGFGIYFYVLSKKVSMISPLFKWNYLFLGETSPLILLAGLGVAELVTISLPI